MIFKGGFRNEVEISVTDGDYIALLKRCEEQGIPLAKVYFQGNAVKLSLPTAALSEFRRLAVECDCFAEAKRFHGVVYCLKQGYRHRVFFGVVCISVVLLVMVLSSVWHYEIRTEEGKNLSTANERQVVKVIKQMGLKFPVLKRELDYDKIADEIRAECPEFAFVGVTDEGVTLKVTVVKRVQEEVSDGVCKNVVAKKDGIIRNIFVLRGQQKIEIGETVSRGQLLISGNIAYEEEGKETVFRQTAAKGMVMASVWYEGIAFISRRVVYPRETGKTSGYIELAKEEKPYLLWGKRRDLFEDSYVYKQSYGFRGMQLNLVTYRETKPGEKRYTETEALQKAQKEAIKNAKAAIPADAEIVAVKCTRLTAAAGAVGIRAVVETKEDIGVVSEENPE